jgi:hypothetical protein
MARVLVVSDDGATVVDIVTDDEGRTEGLCACGERISDRGHFEDTVSATELHVDQLH